MSKVSGLMLLLGIALLSSCGGGGGSALSNPPPPPPPPPSAASIQKLAVTSSSLAGSGGPEVIYWRASNATQYTLTVRPSTGVTGLPTGPISHTMSVVTLPANAGISAQTYTFTLTATGASGTNPAQRSVQVNVSTAGTAPQPLATINWSASVIYFLLPDRFDNGDPANDNGGSGDPQTADTSNPIGWHGGDLQGVINRLQAGYFSQLGVTAIWMTPLYMQGPAQSGPATNNPNAWKHFPYHGYFPADFDNIDPHFGTTALLQVLVGDAHTSSLAVILGQIVNDAGYGYALYTSESEQINSGALKLDNSATALQTFWFHHMDPANGQCEPYTGSYDTIIDCALAGLPDFNSNNAAVQDYLDQSTAIWLRTFGVDGMRLDAAKHVPDSFWAQYFAFLGAQGLTPFAFGEILDGRPGFVGGFTQAGVGFDAAQNYPLYFAITQSGLVPGQSPYYGYSNLAAVDYAVTQNLLKDSDPYRMINFVDNQDMPRLVSLLANNGVTGSDILARWKIAEVLSFTLPGIPMIYYGDEVGMSGTYDPYQAVAKGVPNDNIRKDMTLWAASQRQSAGVQGYYTWLQSLAAVHTSQTSLQTGAYTALFVPGSSAPNVYIYQRGSGSQSVLVAINATGQAVILKQLPSQVGGVPITGSPTGTAGNLLSSGSSSTITITTCASGTCLNGTLPAWSAMVLRSP